MILAIEIGNTHVVTGVFNGNGEILLTFRVASNEKMTEDEYFSYLRNISLFHKVDIKDVEGIVVASVVPGLLNMCRLLSQKYFNQNPIIIDGYSKYSFKFAENILNYQEVFGADRITIITQALKEYDKKNMILIDLGTATNYEVLKEGVYIGGGILPGIDISINALFSNTAKLPKVKFSKPDSVLGKNTVEQIQAGIFFGYAGQIKYIIKKIKEKLEDPFIIATGGLGRILSAEIEEINIYNPDLGIKGLYTLYHMNKE
ncbi:MAG: type III pantothenate kinase [Fusobacteriaceae bacterium]